MSAILSELVRKINVTKTLGTTQLSVSAVYIDSRKVEKNGLFVALVGQVTDGHTFISLAIERGATSVVCEKLPDEIKQNVTYLLVTDSSKFLGDIMAVFYDNPSQKIKLIGVTGTNGKTTTTTLLFDLFTNLGYKCGLISTVENRILTTKIASTHTTPDAIGLNQLLSEMVDAGCDYAFMEVSSHAIHQQRTAGVIFSGGIFTNITHEHLDYHKTFGEYINVKKKFFDELPKAAFMLINIDDKRGDVMSQNTKAKKYTYSLRREADFRTKIIENNLEGLQLSVNNKEFHARLIGKFNAYNLTAAYATAAILGIESEEILKTLSNLSPAEGRFDVTFSSENKIFGIVDYAHTPDALENVLQTVSQIQQGNGHLITVVGCGGNRDRAKRPLMAKIACEYSHHVILTSDNPRSEDPQKILSEMESGVGVEEKVKVLVIENRLQAIKTAARLAKKGDIIVVAGKGHEKYQILQNETIDFDDKKILQEAMGVSSGRR